MNNSNPSIQHASTTSFHFAIGIMTLEFLFNHLEGPNGQIISIVGLNHGTEGVCMQCLLWTWEYGCAATCSAISSSHGWMGPTHVYHTSRSRYLFLYHSIGLVTTANHLMSDLPLHFESKITPSFSSVINSAIPTKKAGHLPTYLGA